MNRLLEAISRVIEKNGFAVNSATIPNVRDLAAILGDPEVRRMIVEGPREEVVHSKGCIKAHRDAERTRNPTVAHIAADFAAGVCRDWCKPADIAGHDYVPCAGMEVCRRCGMRSDPVEPKSCAERMGELHEAAVAERDRHREERRAIVEALGGRLSDANLVERVKAVVQDRNAYKAERVKAEACAYNLRLCSVCAGKPNEHASGKPCVCGDGTRDGEVRGLRAMLAFEEASNSKARADEVKLRALREYLAHHAGIPESSSDCNCLFDTDGSPAPDPDCAEGTRIVAMLNEVAS